MLVTRNHTMPIYKIQAGVSVKPVQLRYHTTSASLLMFRGRPQALSLGAESSTALKATAAQYNAAGPGSHALQEAMFG